MCYIYHGPEVYTTNQPSVFSWLPFLSSDSSNPLAALGFTFRESIETYSTAFRLQQPIAQQLFPIFSQFLPLKMAAIATHLRLLSIIKSRAYMQNIARDIFMARTRRAIPRPYDCFPRGFLCHLREYALLRS